MNQDKNLTTTSNYRNRNSKINRDITAHRPTKAQTLRRDIVKKPSTKFNPSLNLKIQSVLRSNPIPDIKKTPYVSRINHDRLYHAKATTKSNQIKKFNSIQKATSVEPIFQTPLVPKNKLNAELKTVPSFSKKNSIFEKAIENATSHQQIFQPVQSQKIKNNFSLKYKLLIATTLAILITVGFLTYQNLPINNSYLNSELTNFITKMPTYQIPGFYNATTYKQFGLYSVTFLSHTDQRKYQLTESPVSSNIKAQILKYVTTTYHNNYQTFTISNITVYISSNNSATWIKNNLWYKLSNFNNTLTINQIFKIVKSS